MMVDHGDASASRSVLIVEDEQALVEVLADLLELEGYTVAVAASVDEASRKLEAGLEPDLALVDISLPDGPAWPLISRLRWTCPDAKIIIISGLGVVIDDSQAAMADAVLSKPFRADELLALIRGPGQDQQ